MKLICIFNDQHKILFDRYFQPSMKDEFEIIPKQTEKTDYYKVCLEKIEYLADQMRENMGQPIVCMDVDIQKFGPVLPIFQKCLEQNDAFFLRKDQHQVNTGLIGVNCNEKTLQFFEGAIQTAHLNSNADEDAINYGLRKYPHFLKFAILGDKFWCGHRYWKENGIVPNHTILLHHATGTTSVPHKMIQLDLFKNQIPTVKSETSVRKLF